MKARGRGPKAFLSLFAVVLALQLHGSARQTAPANRSPATRVIALPDFWGASAIWGATGHDRRGHVWFGITSNDEKTALPTCSSSIRQLRSSSIEATSSPSSNVSGCDARASGR